MVSCTGVLKIIVMPLTCNKCINKNFSPNFIIAYLLWVLDSESTEASQSACRILLLFFLGTESAFTWFGSPSEVPSSYPVGR